MSARQRLLAALPRPGRPGRGSREVGSRSASRRRTEAGRGHRRGRWSGRVWRSPTAEWRCLPASTRHLRQAPVASPTTRPADVKPPEPEKSAAWCGGDRGTARREGGPDGTRNASMPEGKGEMYGGGAAAQPDADGGTACLATIARTGAPRGAAPPHSVTIQAYRHRPCVSLVTTCTCFGKLVS